MLFSPLSSSWLTFDHLYGSDGKESACNVEALVSIPGLGRSPGGEQGNPLLYSCLENAHGQRSWAGYNPWGCKESDITEWLSTHIHTTRRIDNRSRSCVIWFTLDFNRPCSMVSNWVSMGTFLPWLTVPANLISPEESLDGHVTVVSLAFDEISILPKVWKYVVSSLFFPILGLDCTAFSTFAT